jgi:hypothetical protein
MNRDQITQIIVDIWKLTPVQVYRKHGIGFQTQIKIQNFVNKNLNKLVRNVKSHSKVKLK